VVPALALELGRLVFSLLVVAFGAIVSAAFRPVEGGVMLCCWSTVLTWVEQHPVASCTRLAPHKILQVVRLQKL
jgi:hypothetical protein